ncbi:thermonuclease family protein [Ruegeria marisrubri]|uniref:thermonuclease family protein n=1 Tax=Ruegeria marisrubri TaxID=1685379 RepID=UPI003084098A
MLFVLALVPLAATASETFSGRVRVVDADTWDVGGVRVRLHGIDAPELDQTCRYADGTEWRCGVWATQRVRVAYEGHKARCRPVDQDRYGRIVANCAVQGVDAAQVLVGKGLAFAYRKYSLAYVSHEWEARRRKAGLHAGEAQEPWLYRSAGADGAPGGTCRIKGNISSGGERIYHVPGQKHYARTKISPGKGERWFCSAAEARSAGWRAALQ